MSGSIMSIGGVSDAAQYLAKTMTQDRRHLQSSSAFGTESVRDELGEVWDECRLADWDGYGARAVTHDTLRNAIAFLEAWPVTYPRPTMGADPHGNLTFEWYRTARRLLTVAITPDSVLHYAALLGSAKASGTETFYGEIPESIIALVRRVVS